ncbi:D-hexose-6-phosphate mutarotase [Sulfurimonas sp.]
MYKIKKLENGFEYIEVKNDVASAKIAFQGAHIFSYKRSNKEELLWVSSLSAFTLGSAIRGGIPICWPRFGNLDKSLPQHGFARTAVFELVEVIADNNTLTTVHLRLKSSNETKKLWAYAFTLDILFHISNELKIEMITTNNDTKEFLITQAFHAYFKLSDIKNIEIFGLENKPFLDSLVNEEKVQKGSIRINEEVDRIYQKANGKIILQDLEKRLEIQSKHSSSVIVWNPWIKKCSQMSGMEKEGYKSFVCIESANAVDDFVMLGANESFSIEVSYN